MGDTYVFLESSCSKWTYFARKQHEESTTHELTVCEAAFCILAPEVAAGQRNERGIFRGDKIVNKTILMCYYFLYI
jgi:hypothetical protein